MSLTGIAAVLTACTSQDKDNPGPGDSNPIFPTYTLIPNGTLPTVTINGNFIHVTPYTPPNWDIYSDLCSEDNIYYFTSPDGQEITTYSTAIKNNHQTNQSQASFGCYNSRMPWYVLNNNPPFRFDDNFQLTVETHLGDNALLLDSRTIQMGINTVWIPYAQTGTVGIVTVDLNSGSYQNIWNYPVPNSTRHTPDVYPDIQGENLVLHISSWQTIPSTDGVARTAQYLSHIAVFNKDSGDFRGIVELPQDIQNYNATTLEEVPFNDINNYLINSFSDPVVLGDTLWISHYPTVDPKTYPVLDAWDPDNSGNPIRIHCPKRSDNSFFIRYSLSNLNPSISD